MTYDRKSCYVLWAGVAVLMAWIVSLFLGLDIHKRDISTLKNKLSVETAALEVQTERIAIMQAKIARRDKLLDHWMGMGGEWNKECEYEHIPDIQLADKSWKSSLIQICNEEQRK